MIKHDHDKSVLRITQREVYGNTLTYVEGDAAKHITALTGRKTLTASDIRALEALGFVFVGK